MTFDHATAFFFVGLLYVFIPLITWIVAAGAKRRETTLWCIGGLVIGFSTLWMVILQKHMAWLPYVFGMAALTALGNACKALALLGWLGKQPNLRLGALALLLYLFLAYVLSVLVGDKTVRAYFLCSQLLFYGALGYLAFRVYVLDGQKNALWIMGNYVVVTMMLVVSVMVAWGAGLLWQAGWVAAALSILGAMTAVVNHIGYFGMLLENSRRSERAIQEEVKAAQMEVAVHSARSALSRALALSQRERLMANVSKKLLHELSQPLTIVRTSVRLLRRALEDHRLAELNMEAMVKRLDGAAEVAAGILDQIRPFGKSNPVSIERLDLREILCQTLDLMELATAYVRESPSAAWAAPAWVRGNRVELIQVLINLITNAEQACKHAGVTPVIDISIDRLGASEFVTISDNGPGFDPTMLAHAGQMIFSTKTEGMGIGLWLCQEIVERHGGSLTFSNQAQGARVVLCLPALQESES